MWRPKKNRNEQGAEPSSGWGLYKAGDALDMSIAELAKANNHVFAGYYIPISHTAEGFAAFCRILSMDLARSIILRHKNGKLVGVAMLAVRADVGWCGGFGIVPEFRGQGIASLLLSALLERARAARLKIVRLEVLEGNEPAVRTYRRGGFRVERPVAVMSAPIRSVTENLRRQASRVSTTEEMDRNDGTRIALAMQDVVRPTWQRELATISQISDLRALAARKFGRTDALLLYRADPASGGITIDYCVFDDPESAVLLLETVSRIHAVTPVGPRAPEIVALNEPEGSPLYNLLSGLGFIPQDRQYEMFLNLPGDSQV